MFGERIEQINKFAQGVADIQLVRNPLSEEVVIIFNETFRDQYQDPTTKEVDRVVKIALVSKNPSMSYVQETFDDLLEDDLDNLPWTIAITMTNLPRRPSMDDCIVIGGTKYTIAKVTPVNRKIQSIIWMAVYPERTHCIDEFKIYNIEVEDSISTNGDKIKVLNIIYGGNPVEYSFDDENWHKFRSKIELKDNAKIIYLKDNNTTIQHAIQL